MIPRRAVLLRVVVPCLLLCTALFSGCSKSTKPPNDKPPVIPQRDADDIVQHIAMTIASDYGGWYFTVTAMAESLVAPAPTTLASRPAVMPALSSRREAFNTFTLTRAGVSYDFLVTYYRSDQSTTAVRDTSSDNLEATVKAVNGSINGNGVEATYGHSSEDSYVVFDLKATHDTLEFSNIVDDSTFGVIHSVFQPDTADARLWYHLNFFDYELKIAKADIPAKPYPAAGSEVNYILEVYGMGGFDRNDKDFDYLAEATMSFDGTENALFTLADFDEGTYSYKYKVNLKTGVISRYP